MLGLLLPASLAAFAQGASLDLRDALIDVLDEPHASVRQPAARELASRPGVSIEQWVSAIEHIRSPPEEPLRIPGVHKIRVPLDVLGSTEETELVVFDSAGSSDRIDPDERGPRILLAFHGTGGNGEEVEPMWRATADALGMIVLAPTEAGKNEGYGYSPRERAAAIAALRWAKRRFYVEENRVYATGVSRGGHLAWDLALRHPDLFAAIAPMIGGPRFQLDHGQNNLRFLENVVSLPIRDLQGAQDDPALVGNVRVAFKKLEKLGARDAKLFEFPQLGHSFEFAAVDWKQFFGAAKRDPIPDRVVLLASKVEGSRAYWVEITKLAKEVTEDVVPTVAASTWKGLDENGRREFLEAEVEKRTARLEVRMTAPGRFTATGEHVLGFRLLLAKSMFDPAKPVQVLFAGKLVEKKVVPDAKVLLGEFVERFDRSFLPIAVVDVP